MGFEYIEVSSPDGLSSILALAQRWISGQRRFKRMKGHFESREERKQTWVE